MNLHSVEPLSAPENAQCQIIQLAAGSQKKAPLNCPIRDLDETSTGLDKAKTSSHVQERRIRNCEPCTMKGGT